MKYLFGLLFTIGGFLVFPHTAYMATYYIDQTNGSDANAGTASSTAFYSITKFADNARSAGDCAYVRRGTATTTVYSDIVFTSDGTLNQPICISADNDNIWGDFSASAQTYTVTQASSTMVASGNITGITAGDWVYFTADQTASSTSPSYVGKDYAYEVASTTQGSLTTLTLYLPYKGTVSGSGLTLQRMPPAPQWNNTAGDFQWTAATDLFWYIQGIDVRGTDSNCNLNITSSPFTFKDMVVQSDNTTSCGTNTASAATPFFKSRFFGSAAPVTTAGGAYMTDFLIDCNSASNAAAFTSPAAMGVSTIINGVVQNCTNFMTNRAATLSQTYNSWYIRNVSSNNTVTNISAGGPINLYYEDKFGTLGLNSQTSNQATSDTAATTTIKSTAVLRSGGGSSNLLVFPPTGTAGSGISTNNFPLSYIKLFEYPIYVASNTPYTYSMYFKQASTTNISDWTTDPTAAQMWIEADYYAEPSGTVSRYVKKSTGTLDFNGTNDWQALSVSATSTQSGLLYLRGYYAKPRESGKENSFYMDTKVQISSP